MRRLEGIVDTGDEFRIDRARWGRHADFHRLAGVAHVGLAREADARALDAVFFQRGDRVTLEACINLSDHFQIDSVLMRDLGHDVIGAPIDGQETEGRKVAGIGRHDASLHADQLHHRWRLRRAGTAERQQRELAWIDAALDRHLPDGVGLIPIGDLDDAPGQLLRRHAAGQFRRQRGDTGARALDVKHDAAADQRRRQPAQHQIGVGDSRLSTAFAVTHRSGFGAGALRADFQMALAGDPGDRAAARADGLDIDHRHPHRKTPDHAAIGDIGLGVFDQAQIGRSAAGIEGDEIGKARDLGDHRAADGAGRRPGQRRGDRLPHHLIGTGDAARSTASPGTACRSVLARARGGCA